MDKIPIFLDVETSGLVPDDSYLLSIGAIIGDDIFYEVLDHSTKFIDKDYETTAFKINGLTKKDLQCGKDPIDVCALLLEFFEKHNVTPRTHCLVGINIGFDIKFLESEFKLDDYNYKLPYQNIDLTSVALIKLGICGSDDISKKLNITPELRPHNALNGARQNKLIYEKLVEIL